VRSGTAVREALLNVVSGTSRAVGSALLLLIVTLGLTGLDLAAVRQLDTQAQNFVNSGASISTLSAPGRIDGALCEALNGVAGVRAAGALRKVADLHPSHLPNTSVPVYEVTPGLAKVVLRDEPVGPLGLVVSAEAAETLGVAKGGSIATATGDALVAGVYPYPEDGRVKAFSYAALSRVPAEGRFDECWVDHWPVAAQVAPLLRNVMAPGTADDPGAVLSGQLNDRLGRTVDAHGWFSSRLTAWAPVATGLAGWALGFAAVRGRRLELTSALHVGVGRLALQGMLLAESAVWTLPTLLAGGAVSAAFARIGLPGDGTANLILGLFPVLSGVLGALLGVQTAGLSLREERLFDHFKQR